MKTIFLCIASFFSLVYSFYTPIECPERCICLNFTDCKNNDFTKLPSGLDPNVTILDLAYNKFRTFPNDLSNYYNLRYLNLSHNKLQSLSGRPFIDLRNLERLDLSHNLFRNWSDIGSNSLSSAENLMFLDISNNVLKSLQKDKHPLQIKSLQILRLNNCSIEYVNNKILEKLPNLAELHLSGNPIKYIEANLLSSSLRFLDFSNCDLRYLNPLVFKKLSSLETLYMYQNKNLKKFSCDSESLLYLDLSECNLENVPDGSLPNVYFANFYGNHFRKIPSFSFENYTNLETLDLSSNALSEIEKDGFTRLFKIQKIDLSQNRLTKIDTNLFESNENLKNLNLSRNYFNSFQNLVSDSLEILDLSHCEISTIQFDSLIFMESLKILYLSKNLMSLLPDNWEAENLLSLDVSLCRIKSINNKTFSLMPSLRHIDLSGNRLTTATPESFSQVFTLNVTDNLWRCDCTALKPFYTWLTKTGKPTEGLYCQSPEAVEGKYWLSACQKEWYPDQARSDSVWWYTVGLIVTVFFILFVILAMRRMYLLKEKRLREADQARRIEEREALRRMQRRQAEVNDEVNRNAPDPRELQTPPSYNEALLLPRLDASHPSLSGSLHSIASKHSINGSLTDVSKRHRPRRKRRRRKSDSSEGQRSSRVVVDSDTTDAELPQLQPRVTLESDF